MDFVVNYFENIFFSLQFMESEVDKCFYYKEDVTLTIVSEPAEKDDLESKDKLD